MKRTKLKILFLYIRPVLRNAQAIVDHALSFRRHSSHDVTSLLLTYPFGSLPPGLDLSQFDVLAIHYTVAANLDTYLNPEARGRIARFDGLKVQFLQDEYRHVNDSIQAVRQLGIDVLFTCVPEAEVEKVYPAVVLPGVRKVTVLTGYVPEILARRPVPAIAQRPVDVGYRARKPPYWLGELGLEKSHIAEGFLAATQGAGLVCDIACDEQSRLYGRRWTRFLTSCKCVLGVESGASVFDFTGQIQHDVEAYRAAHPAAGFEEVRARFFAAEEGRIRLNQISPRCFEAAALRTGMVLFEGEYSGILVPGRHYIPLRKDFGNIDSVVQQLRDPVLLQEYADRTHEEIALNPSYSYAAFVALFDDAVEQEFGARVAGRRGGARKPTGALRGQVMIPLGLRLFRGAQVAAYYLRGFWFYLLVPAVYRTWLALPEAFRAWVRPVFRSLLERVSARPRPRG